MTTPLPRLAITIGDPAGVGPELSLRAIADTAINSICQPFLVGQAAVLRRCGQHLSLPVPPCIPWTNWIAGATIAAPAILDTGDAGSADDLNPGTFTASTGQASFDAFSAAVGATIDGHFKGVVTGPIQKEAWRDAGVPFPGHTEALADQIKRSSGHDSSAVRMMLTSPQLACVLETIHVPLADVAAMLQTDSIVHTIELAGQTILRRNRSRGSLLPPRIAVLGLNPHAGEHGLFSRGEEERVIEPAIALARQAGWDVAGPLPPDTAFTPSIRNRVDVYVCMYHDQGLIPLKALSFDNAVNVTLGLPIVRTSVDHGTAMDIAWKGIASHTSLIAAIELAAHLSAS